jgi:hypothetical protein
MSLVTNLIVSHSLAEEEAAQNLSAWFEAHGGIRSLTAIGTDHWGGNKAPECELVAGAYNVFDLDAFWQHMSQLRWNRPDEVQVFVKEQLDRRFQVWAIEDGAFVRLLDGSTESNEWSDEPDETS